LYPFWPIWPQCARDGFEDPWLHKTVLARIAANGGNIPAELLD